MSQGELAQMVERPLRMREVPGSIPGFSILFYQVVFREFVFAIHCYNLKRAMKFSIAFSIRRYSSCFYLTETVDAPYSQC